MAEEMADGEHTTDGHGITPANNELQENAQPGPLPVTAVAPDNDGPVIGINEVLIPLPVPKKTRPPELMPKVDYPHDGILAKGKELQGHDDPPSNLEAIVPHVGGREEWVPLILHQIKHLENVGSSQVSQLQLKNFIYTQEIERFNKKRQYLTPDEVISEEKNLAFLRQLLNNFLDVQEFDAKKENTPRFLSNSTPAGVPPDPVLEALAAAPLSYRRRASANDIPARIPHQ